MKKLIVFKSLILATLFLFPTMMSCSNDDPNVIETNLLYSQLPSKFAVVKTWFENNPTTPSPTANTGVEIDEGNQTEHDHAIGTYYYEIDIDDYHSGEKQYDVEFYLDENLTIIAVIVNDIKVSTNSNEYAVAETQLKEDYKAYTVGKITWSTQREYQLASFTITTKSESQAITAWYTVSGVSATREMDSENLGTIIPAKIKAAFDATKYNDASVWKIVEVELEHNYNNNGIESFYEVELENIEVPTLEAELFFSSETGQLLYAKEKQDEDDNDKEDDKFVVNAKLKAAVEAAVPNAKIIEAEMDGQFIEVEAILTTNGITEEIELKFTMDYQLVSSETETKYSYSHLPEKFNVVKTWFANHSEIPAPPANTEVEITEGEQTEIEHSIGKYYYEVEIDDYTNGIEYDVEFYLNETREIIAVIVNEIKQAK